MKSWFRFPIFIGFILVFLPLFGLAVMLLWNGLIPELFGGPEVSYWQAVGLLALTKILFGHGPGGRGSPRHRKHKMWWHMMQKWDRMSPEEREKMREQWKSWGEEWRKHEHDKWEAYSDRKGRHWQRRVRIEYDNKPPEGDGDKKES